MSTRQNNQDNTFYLGICMAGAVSAGAYTAGVMDYLLEALTAWQQKKDENVPGTPSHNVVIPTLGGASAGGMTAIITAAALNTDLIPVRPPLTNIMANHPENKLYHSWVDLSGPDMFQKMLSTGDLEDDKITSLLNSDFIDEVANRAIQPHGTQWKELPKFIHPDLKIFTTLTNLNGFPFNIGFKAGKTSEKYHMSIHNDYACFKLGKNTDDTPVEDGWMVLDFRSGSGLSAARDAAMATGAFPVGLKSRKLSRTADHVNKMEWCEVTKHFPWVAPPTCDTLNVDGGVINNEPFERVREALLKLTGETKQTLPETGARSYEKDTTFKSTIIMVDPFPSKKPGDFNNSDSLFNVIGRTFGAMLEQMRAKPGLLSEAMSLDNSGQFLIAPSRRRKNTKGVEEDVAGDEAIACGALGGFSGFMSKEFRVHDYILGRLNCEVFLRSYFTISEEALAANPIFSAGYDGVDKSRFRSKAGGYQIIPIFTPAPPDNYFPMPVFSGGGDWPCQKEETIESFRPLVKKRVKVLASKAINAKGFTKLLLWIGSKVVLNRMLTNAAMNAIKKGLQKYQLLPKN